MQTKYLTLSFILVLVLGLAGCAAPPKTLYGWGTYEQQVAQTFKPTGSDVAQQINAMEIYLPIAEKGGLILPPGYHAHLGFLYSTEGKLNEAQQQFNAEKIQYPESAVFMDFVLNKIKKSN